MQLLTETHVGNAIPFLKSFSFLKTLLVSSNISLSPNSHISRTDAPTTHLSMTCFSTPKRRGQRFKQLKYLISDVVLTQIDLKTM